MITDNAVSSDKCACEAQAVDPEDILDILSKHGEDRAGLVSILGAIQAKYRYLPADALRVVAEKTGIPLVDVYAAATFYRSFSLTPKGRHLFTVCLGTACHVRGAPRIAEEFEAQLRIRAGETTPDGEFTLETVNCLGACALGPVVVMDGSYFSKVKKPEVKQLIDAALNGLDQIQAGEDQRLFPIEVDCPLCGHSLMDENFAIDDHPSIRLMVNADHNQGWLRLSSLYGSHNIAAEYDIPLDTVASLRCPHCEAELRCSWDCPTCGAPMAAMALRGGGTVRICARRGCRSHMLDLS